MSILSPRVSIVVPSFNEAPHIVLASFESLRAQTFVDFECIVVDESTRPELAEACRQACSRDRRFIYVHPSERLGLARSLNLAISRARGELIARFDSDDISLPKRLAKQVAFLDANLEIGVLGGAMEIINESEVTAEVRNYPVCHQDIVRKLQFTNAFAHPTIIFRRRIVESYGGYNEEYRFSEDLELWLRWFKCGVKFANLPDVLVRYRQDLTRRDAANWQYNIRARLLNFGSELFILRLLGIAIIGAWAIIPSSLQELIYKKIIFNKKQIDL